MLSAIIFVFPQIAAPRGLRVEKRAACGHTGGAGEEVVLVAEGHGVHDVERDAVHDAEAPLLLRPRLAGGGIACRARKSVARRHRESAPSTAAELPRGQPSSAELGGWVRPDAQPIAAVWTPAAAPSPDPLAKGVRWLRGAKPEETTCARRRELQWAE